MYAYMCFRIHEERTLELLLVNVFILFIISWIYNALNFSFIPLQNDRIETYNVFFRVRLFFTEPAYLGYWSATLCFLSYQRNKNYLSVGFLFFLFISTSTGAYVYAFLLFSCYYIKITNKKAFLYIFIIFTFSAVIYYVNAEQIQSKLSTDSMSFLQRFDNFLTSISYIKEQEYLPSSFSPMLIGSESIGFLNFNLLLFKALSFFSLLCFYRIIKFSRLLLPYLFMSFMVGSYWETPLLFLLVYPHVFSENINRINGEYR